MQALNLYHCWPLQQEVTSASRYRAPMLKSDGCAHSILGGGDAGKYLLYVLMSPFSPPQMSHGLFHEEPLPYLVHQPLPWQVQYVTQSRRTSRDSEVCGMG